MTTRTLDWTHEQVKSAAGIHFTTFNDKSEGATDREAEAIEAGAATMQPGWRPDPHEKAAYFTAREPKGA